MKYKKFGKTIKNKYMYIANTGNWRKMQTAIVCFKICVDLRDLWVTVFYFPAVSLIFAEKYLRFYFFLFCAVFIN